jgi:hypothetical protein
MADMKWPKFLRCLSKLVDVVDIKLKEAAQLPWRVKARLVRSDPVTSARYHRHKMETLLTMIINVICLHRFLMCFPRSDLLLSNILLPFYFRSYTMQLKSYNQIVR